VKIDTPCTACRGRGRRRAHESVEVQIPAGIMSGQRLRMPGRGHTGESGAARGDLYVNVTVVADERFEREGNDIVSVLDVPFTRAAMGTSTTIETLDGRHELEIRPGTQPGEVLVLRGKGIPVLGGRGRGDHRVVVNVLVPRKLSDEQRALLDRFEGTVDDATYAADDGFFQRLRTAFR
jgi:molecular chaperone DnaJ